jgi:deazaflavin-dependent oxidoreductase (nitroreductase family)
MDDATRTALGHGQLIEMTTKGAKSGLPRSIDIVLHNFDQHLYISGVPNAAKKRAWLANLEANPAFTIRLQGSPTALAARARVIGDPTERRAILARVAKVWNRTDVDVMVEHSPLIEATVEGYPE